MRTLPDPEKAKPCVLVIDDDEAVAWAIAGRLGPALDTLSVMERTAFIMRHYEGLGIEEIGRILEVQPNAAKHSVFRAVQKLRRVLEPLMEGAK